MSEVFDFYAADSPLLISVPHDGRNIPAAIAERMTDTGRAIPDTDWHVGKLYGFAASIGASLIAANYSRYVVDLNRSAADEQLYPGKFATGLCPLQTFAGEPIYKTGEVDERERAARVDNYWRPYHDQIARTLAAIRDKHGYALLWDAHSIPSEVPRLFDGALKVLNLGSNDATTCAPQLEKAVALQLERCPYSHVVNGRFKGGHITRHFGQPEKGIHALQLEIAQRAYMDEESGVYNEVKAVALQDTLRALLSTYVSSAKHN